MNRPRSRRRFLAATAPVALAGCLVEDGTDATDRGEQATEPDRPAENEQAAESDATGAGNRSGDTRPVADAPGEAADYPDSAGIGVEAIGIVRIIESFRLSQIVADVVVRNSSDHTYGTLELRVDAYYEPPSDDRTYHPPRVDERTAVGSTYVDRTFEAFDSGTRTFENVVVRYDAGDANGSTDPAEFDMEIAVRRAEPA